MPSYEKRVGAVEAFALDWSRDLASGETLNGSSWSLPSGIGQTSASFDTTTTTIKLNGGTAGETYVLVNTVTTTNGNTYTKDMVIFVP